ncbi:MAG: DUF1266 domain-containing protein [Deltaproteobacteria bacterium]|jgi:hypothetical protein|nr:DUF1266 domain-containing protein [Deltaproteobacteria bacterium]
MLTKLINGAKQLFRTFTQKDFTKNPNAPVISEDQKKALALGLINGEQITAYTDSLTTGLPKERVAEGLNEAWDVFDGEDALRTIEFLKKGGHRVAFEAVLPFINVTDESERIARLRETLAEQREKIIFSANDEEDSREKFDRELERLTGFANNLIECVAEPGQDPFVPFDEKNIKNGILAWDMGRLVLVARLCRDAGFIDDKTAWDAIIGAYETAKETFNDWREVAASYLIGRGTWGGYTMMLKGPYTIAEDAFENDNSPWKRLSFK